MATLTLLRQSVDEGKFNAAPAQERLVFARALTINMEICTLHKLLIFAVNTAIADRGCKELRSASHFNAFFFMRILASLSHEAYEFFKVAIKGGPGAEIEGVPTPDDLLQKYEAELDELTKTQAVFLEEYLSQHDNTCDKIRNQFSFHYMYRTELSVLSRPDPRRSSDLFFDDSHANCYYPWAAEALILKLFETLRLPYTNEKEFSESFSKVGEDIRKVAGAFLDFFGGYIVWFGEKFLDIRNGMTEFQLGDVPSSQAVGLPYFILPSAPSSPPSPSQGRGSK